MSPQIQYAQTSDGVSIAYCVYGEGPPLVVMPSFPFSHIQLEWAIPECRDWYASLAVRRQIICYDPRGSGLSDRQLPTYSVATLVRDLVAVVDRLGLDRFSLFAPIDLSAAGIAYAADHPERVAHLIVWCGYSQGSDLENAPETQSWLSLMDKDWRVVTQSWAHNMVGWSEGDLAGRLAEVWRESCSPAALPAFWNATLAYNVDDMLPRVQAPALMLHRRDFGVVTVDAARRLAAKIPNARLTLLEGSAGMPFAGDTEAVVAAMEEFLDGGPQPSRGRPTDRAGSTSHARDASTAIILFADIVGSTALTERMGDAAFREKARALDAELRTAVRNKGGVVIDAKTLGDGILATFPAASQAIAAALACGAAGNAQGLPLHLGLHAGDVIRESDNVFGGAVNIAARISALAPPGELFVSRTVADLARTSAGVTFEDRGEHALKGVGEPQRIYAVRPNR